MSSRLAAVLLTGVALAGCSRPLSGEHGVTTQIWTAGGYRIVCRTGSEANQLDPTPFHLVVGTSAGHPLSSLGIVVSATMPSMRMPSTPLELRRSPIGPTTVAFSGTLRYTMAGTWADTVTIVEAGHVISQHAVRVVVH
ncbi:MAG: hypothetical protein ACLQVD_08685 [Capsulimonadaceae bacterium]